MGIHHNQSEISRLLQQIESEYRGAWNGLSGLAEMAKHQAITARMEHLGCLHERLREIVGEDATRLVVEVLNTIPGSEQEATF